MPFDINPLIWEILAHDGAGEITLRVATHTITTEPTDNPPNTVYTGAVVDPGNIQHAVFDGIATSGRANVDTGLIELANTGELDAWFDYGWGRQAILKTITALGDPIAGATQLLRIHVAGVESADAPRSLRLRLKGRLVELDQPLLTERYLGTTNQFFAADIAEGEADLTGQLKPQVYGTAVNVPVKLVNPYALIYQIASNPLFAITVYDGGLEIPAEADFPSLQAMRDATTTAGFCATCLAEGCFKLGAIAQFMVTADVIESSGHDAGTHSASQVIQRMLAEAEVTDLDTTSFDAFHTFNSAKTGIYISDERSILDLVSDVADSVGGAIVDTSAGQFAMVWLTEPSATVEATYSLRDLLADVSMQLFTGPSNEGQGIPAYAVTVRWGKIWQTQDTSDLAAFVDEARKQFLKTEWRETNTYDLAVLTKHPQAVVLVFDTMLANETDAVAEAARRLALYKIRRDRLSFPLSFASDDTAGDIALGLSVKVQMARFGYDAGKNFMVIGRKDDFKLKVRTLNLWG